MELIGESVKKFTLFYIIIFAHLWYKSGQKRYKGRTHG
jgi:hypothetical protein